MVAGTALPVPPCLVRLAWNPHEESAMKVFLSTELEGTAGVVDWTQGRGAS
jgi:hypothetical protein